MNEWSALEQAAARMIEDTLARHAVEMESKLQKCSATMEEQATELEATRKKLDDASQRCLETGASLREAEGRFQEAVSKCTQCKRVVERSEAEVERARNDLAVAQKEVAAFCDGPMSSFLTLNGTEPAERMEP